MIKMDSSICKNILVGYVNYTYIYCKELCKNEEYSVVYYSIVLTISIYIHKNHSESDPQLCHSSCHYIVLICKSDIVLAIVVIE